MRKVRRDALEIIVRGPCSDLLDPSLAGIAAQLQLSRPWHQMPGWLVSAAATVATPAKTNSRHTEKTQRRTTAHSVRHIMGHSVAFGAVGAAESSLQWIKNDMQCNGLQWNGQCVSKERSWYLTVATQHNGILQERKNNRKDNREKRRSGSAQQRKMVHESVQVDSAVCCEYVTVERALLKETQLTWWNMMTKGKTQHAEYLPCKYFMPSGEVNVHTCDGLGKRITAAQARAVHRRGQNTSAQKKSIEPGICTEQWKKFAVKKLWDMKNMCKWIERDVKYRHMRHNKDEDEKLCSEIWLETQWCAERMVWWIIWWSQFGWMILTRNDGERGHTWNGK